MADKDNVVELHLSEGKKRDLQKTILKDIEEDIDAGKVKRLIAVVLDEDSRKPILWMDPGEPYQALGILTACIVDTMFAKPQYIDEPATDD